MEFPYIVMAAIFDVESQKVEISSLSQGCFLCNLVTVRKWYIKEVV